MNITKNVWIIGASSGIGKSLSLLLAENNWQVAISSRNQSHLEKIASQSANLFPFPLDITKPTHLESAKESVLQALGSIDTVFLNAGDYSPMALEEFDPLLFEKLIAVNYLGVVNGLNVILPYLLAKKSGEIYITASLAGYRGLPKSAPYNASKAAVISLAESLHLELKQKGVRLRVINPGFVKSPLTDKNDFKMPFMISPEKAAHAIFRELPASNFEITFPKRFAWLMKLLRLLPYRLYFFLMKGSLTQTTNNQHTKGGSNDA